MNLYPLSDYQIYDLTSKVVALLAGTYLLMLVVRRLSVSSSGLAIGAPIAAAFIVRLLAANGLDQTPIAAQLRGGDEGTFLSRAQDIAEQGIASSLSLDALTTELHTFLFSLFARVLDPPPDMMLRIVMITLAVTGIAFLATTVYELAGAKAARLAAWIVALEPTNVFFSGILHKEPFMFLAEGLLVYGGARVWKRADLRGLAPLAAGCLIAIATRPYVGWFFVAAAAAVVLHASAIHRRADRSAALAAAAVLLACVFVPVAWQKSSSDKLEELQLSQNANVTNENANLSLERVDYSTRGAVVLNLPQRIRDVVLRPYPWQLDNTSQRLGLLGTIVMLVGLILLGQALVQNRTEIMRRAGPLVYPVLFVLAAYALSAGNAGTAFRYRTHVVAIMLCLLVALRQQQAEERVRDDDARRVPAIGPLPNMRPAA